MADEELLRDKVYNRVNELLKQTPGVSRQEVMEEVRKEMGFDKISTVSANYYRGRAADPNAAPSKRGRPKGSKNKATLEKEAAAATTGAPAATATATATPRRRTATRAKAGAKSATPRRRTATTRARAAAGAASSADLNQAVQTLNGLVEENQRLASENRDLREQLGRIADIANI